MLGYLDAGTGSMVVGAVAAGAAGVGVVAKAAWQKVVPGKRRKQDAADDETSDSDEADEAVEAD